MIVGVMRRQQARLFPQSLDLRALLFTLLCILTHNVPLVRPFRSALITVPQTLANTGPSGFQFGAVICCARSSCMLWTQGATAIAFSVLVRRFGLCGVHAGRPFEAGAVCHIPSHQDNRG